MADVEGDNDVRHLLPVVAAGAPRRPVQRRRSPPTSTPSAPPSGTCSWAARRSRSRRATTPPARSARASCTPLPRPPSAPTCRRRSTGCSQQCLAKDPTHRPASALELARAPAADRVRGRLAAHRRGGRGRPPRRLRVGARRCPEAPEDATAMKPVTVISASGPRRIAAQDPAPAAGDDDDEPASRVRAGLGRRRASLVLGAARRLPGLARRRARGGPRRRGPDRVAGAERRRCPTC